MSKRTQLAVTLEALGITRLIPGLRRSPGILVINHHRIGAAESERFHRYMFSASAEQFDQQISHLKRRYHVISLPELQDFIAHPEKLRHFHVMLTFDDGYRDNYDVAFPLLRARGVPATFFLATSLIGSSYLPWWDHVAYMVRHSKQPSLRLRYPVQAEIQLNGNRGDAIEQVLQIYKGQIEVSEAKFLVGLSHAAEVALPPESERRFLNYEEAQEMIAGGMAIGSHTHSHTILSQLSYPQQREELARSKRELEAGLGTGTKIDALAYPVGSRTAFNKETVQALKETGYTTAFSHYYGVNSPTTLNAFDVVRSKPPLHQSLFRLRTSLAAAFNYDWK